MGSYSQALAEPVTSPNYPDITLARQVRTNYGFIVNLEQGITDNLGLFSRTTGTPDKPKRSAGPIAMQVFRSVPC